MDIMSDNDFQYFVISGLGALTALFAMGGSELVLL